MKLVLIFGVCFLSIYITNALENPVIEYCTTRERSSLHGCTLIRVSNSTFEFGKTDQSVAKLQNRDADRFAFFQCTAGYPIRWLARKPLKAIKLLINNETNRFNQDPLSTSPPKYIQQVSINLYEDYSTILRCESFSDPNVAADVFLELHHYRRPFWSSVTETSLYIALNGSQKSFIFPCVAKEFYGNFSLVFARKGSRKVVSAAVSEDCAECICRASSDCSKFPCISSRVCGDIPTPWTSADETDPKLIQEFAECTQSFPCARKIVETYLDNLKAKFTDCNGDGLRTCEDYARVHLLGGEKQCARNLNTTEQRQLTLFQQCLVEKSENFTILSHGIGDYDPRIGLKVNEPPSFTSQYECQSLTEEAIRGSLVLPLDAEQIVPAELYYELEDDQVYCQPSDPIVPDPLVIFGRCSSLLECELTFKAPPPSVIPAIHGLKENQYEIFNTENVPTRTPHKGYKTNFTHAFIQCFGGLTSTFVNEVDYLFTGLDGKKYLISTDYPLSSIISLENKNWHNLSAFGSYSFKCTISTFVLLPNIQFVVHYGYGAAKLGELPSGTKIQIVDENTEEAVMTSELLLNVTTKMTKITCYAPKISSNDWAHAEVNLFVVPNQTAPKPRGKGNNKIVYYVLGSLMALVILLAFVVFIQRRRKALLHVQPCDMAILLSNQNEIEDDLPDTPTVDAICLSLSGWTHKQISGEYLKIDEEIIGEGEFGTVRRGTLHELKVAVKSCRSDVDAEYFHTFLRELKTLTFVGNHPNIVEFHGAVVQNIHKRECLAVFELSSRGNLNLYLRNEAKTVQKGVLNKSILVSFCRQIANGMEFLSTKEVIHGDLASRNVLLFENNVVKLTDFGLARRLYNYCNYTKKKTVALPWRWMALESLRYLEFSVKSDVWSFGVTAWEIFSLARVPFPCHSFSDEFIEKLESGYRLLKPDLASDIVYEMMKSCWQNTAERRPNFSELKQLLVNIERDAHVSDDIYGTVEPMEDPSKGQ